MCWTSCGSELQNSSYCAAVIELSPTCKTTLFGSTATGGAAGAAAPGFCACCCATRVAPIVSEPATTTTAAWNVLLFKLNTLLAPLMGPSGPVDGFTIKRGNLHERSAL